MSVVHACWLRDLAGKPGGRLGLWAEDSSAPARATRRPGRAPKVRSHPFAANHDRLVELLGPVRVSVMAASPSWF